MTALTVNITPRMEPAKPKGASSRSSRKMRVPTRPEASSASPMRLMTLRVSQPRQHGDQGKRCGKPAPAQPGVDRADQQAHDHSEEDRIEERRSQAHSDEHHDRRSEDEKHPQEIRLVRRGSCVLWDSTSAMAMSARTTAWQDHTLTSRSVRAIRSQKEGTSNAHNALLP
jgi:hypothetical protein